jgi:hypothetical protein
MTPLAPLRTIVRRAPVRARAALLALLLAALPVATAQSLPSLLPDEVHAALGLVDLAAVEERLAPFLDEADRLDLVAALAVALGGLGAGDLADEDATLPAPFADLTLLDLVGREAWIAVSASPFDPLPAVTLLARTSPAAQDAFARAIADGAERSGTDRLEEAGRTFYVFVPEGGMLPNPDQPGADVGLPLAYAQLGDLVVLSTDLEVVRFVLRADAGTATGRLTDRPAWQELLTLGDGHVVGFLDPLPLTRALEPLAAASGAGPLLARVQDALATAGPSVGVLRADDEGLLSLGRQRPDPAGPDPALYALLSRGVAPALDLLAFAPAGAPAVSAGTADLPAWWAWLDDVSRAAAELGVPTAGEALELLDLDVDRLLLDWAGDGWALVQTAPLSAARPGAPEAPLLGEQVLLVRSRDDAVAQAALQELFALAGATLGGFLDPSGQGLAAPEATTVAGRAVTRLRLSDTLILDAAVVDGWALLSGSPDATAAVLDAYAAGGGATALASLAADLPDGVRSWSLSAAPSPDDGAAQAAIAQLQLLAGLGGASTLDFEAVDRAAEAIAAYAAFLAERTGPSLSWTRWEDDALVTRQRIFLSW